MPPVLAPPPGHPRRVAVRGRRGRVGLEAELLGGFGDAVDEEVLVPIVAALAHDRAELRQLAIQDARDRVTPTPHDLVQPVGKQRDVRRERQGRTGNVRARVHRREVEDVRGRHQDLGQERIHGDPENQGEAAEPDPLALRPREGRDRAGQQQGKRAIPRVVGRGVVLGRGATGLVHDPCAHEGRARRVDPVPGVPPHAVVGRRAHVPAFHAGFDVAHRSAHNPWAMFILSAAALVTNVWVFAAHVRMIVSKRRNPLTQEVHADEATYASWVRDLASDEDKNSSPRAWARRPRRRALHRRAWGNRAALLHGCPPIAPPCAGRRAATFVEGILAPGGCEKGTIEVPLEIADVPSSHE